MDIADFAEAYRLVFEYIDTFYNTRRIHSHCEYMSPDEYEALYEQMKCVQETTWDDHPDHPDEDG